MISRVGLIYFPDQHRALTRCAGPFAPEAALSAVVYSTPDRNGFFSVPVGIIRRIADLPAPAHRGCPDPFSLGSTGRRRERRTPPPASTDVTVTAVPSPVRMTSAAECVRFERESFGALHQMLSGVDEARPGSRPGGRSRRR